MQDRVSLYPGRVKLVPVAGQENTYNMVRADSPTQEGTPLNKDSLLKDATSALFGLGADAVPDNVFAKIGTFMAGLSNAARIENGKYTGTGTTEKTITFQNPPKLVIVFDTNSKNNVSDGSRSLFFIGINESDGGLLGYESNPVSIQAIPFSISGNKATINKGGHDAYSMNRSGRSYSYVAIG